MYPRSLRGAPRSLAPGRSSPTIVQWIPPGDWGTRATLIAMAATVNASLGDPLVQDMAHQLSRLTNPRDPVAVWRTIRAWLGRHWRFTRDPDGIELVKTPHAQLSELARNGIITGDCDDAATLGATIAKAMGARVRFHVVAFFSIFDGFRHVFTEVATPTGWRDLDVTAPAQVLVAPSRSWLWEA